MSEPKIVIEVTIDASAGEEVFYVSGCHVTELGNVRASLGEKEEALPLNEQQRVAFVEMLEAEVERDGKTGYMKWKVLDINNQTSLD